MLTESIAIVMMLVIIMVLFLRTHHKNYVKATLPLILVPLVNAICRILGECCLWAQNRAFITVTLILALAFSVAMMGINCTQLKSGKTKYSYLFLCGGFSTLLTCILIYSVFIPGR